MLILKKFVQMFAVDLVTLKLKFYISLSFFDFLWFSLILFKFLWFCLIFFNFCWFWQNSRKRNFFKIDKNWRNIISSENSSEKLNFFNFVQFSLIFVNFLWFCVNFFNFVQFSLIFVNFFNFQCNKIDCKHLYARIGIQSNRSFQIAGSILWSNSLCYFECPKSNTFCNFPPWGIF